MWPLVASVQVTLLAAIRPPQACAVHLYVWMANWQMECCGTPFQEGAEVSWRLRHPNFVELAWLDTVLHEGVAATIDAVEDHHGDSSAPLTTDSVASIATLHCRSTRTGCRIRARNVRRRG